MAIAVPGSGRTGRVLRTVFSRRGPFARGRIRGVGSRGKGEAKAGRVASGRGRRDRTWRAESQQIRARASRDTGNGARRRGASDGPRTAVPDLACPPAAGVERAPPRESGAGRAPA